MDMENALCCTLFATYLSVERRASPHTVLSYRTDVMQFSDYLSGLTPPVSYIEATAAVVRGWLVELAKKGISNRSINRKMIALRTFYTFLQKRTWVASNPLKLLKSLKKETRLPVFFQEQELLSFLDTNDFEDTFAGLRDKLLLELIYGTGMRLAELISLQTADVNLIEQTVKVLGKRNKERIIPFPRPLKDLLEAYLAQKQRMGYVTKTLLTTDLGKPCYPMFVYRVVKKYLAPRLRARKHSPHILRHTFATHLLDKGADLKAIKELLGHANLAATQEYTHTSLSKLKEIFTRAHPRAELEDA
jgi:integrase/recombinase XerC